MTGRSSTDMESQGCVSMGQPNGQSSPGPAGFTKRCALPRNELRSRHGGHPGIVSGVRRPIAGLVRTRSRSCRMEIWDAARNVTWRSLSMPQRQRIIEDAVVSRVSTSMAIRVALRSKGSMAQPPSSNGRLGTALTEPRPMRFSRNHLDFVRSERSKLPPGKIMSPADLAKVLNEFGFKPQRAKLWSYNSAKNLLTRLKDVRP